MQYEQNPIQEGIRQENLEYIFYEIAFYCCFFTHGVLMHRGPQKVAYYDDGCEIVAEKLVLTTEQNAFLHDVNDCSNEACVTEITGAVSGAALVVPVSAVVSGSIVVVGNTAYWLQKQGDCVQKNG